MQRITRQHPHSRKSQTPSQKYTQHLAVHSLFLLLDVFFVPSGSEGGFVWFEAAAPFAVVFAPVLFHSSKGDNRPNKRENLTSERQKKETEGGGGAEVKAQQRLLCSCLFISSLKVCQQTGSRRASESSSSVLLSPPQSARKIQNNHIYSCLLFYICCAAGRA